MRARLAVVSLSLALLSLKVGAQDLTGVVRDSATGVPIRGAVVHLLDQRGAAVAQVLTGATGAFRLHHPSEARTIRVRRIGFVPFRAALDSLPAGPVTVVMAALSNRLPVVSVRTSPVCPERRDSHEALALWSAATDGLSALVAASDSGAPPGAITQLLFDKVLDRQGRNVVRQSVNIVRTGNVAPIRADRSAEEFVNEGYVERTQTSMVYYAPDPVVLLDSTFAVTHCLSIRNDQRGHPGEVGVAFEPARGRERTPDIAGVLWMDRSPLALRSLEFEYRGVDQLIMDVQSGGRLDFETLSNGVPIIRSWHVRSPRLAYMTAYSGGRGRPEFQNEVPMVAQRHESGGLIAVGQLADGTVWSTPLAHVAGRVLDSRTEGPVRGALVRLDSTDYVTTSDASGQFSFEGVLPGPYVARVSDTLTIYRRRAHPDSGFLIDLTSPLQFVTRTTTAYVDAQLGRTDAFDVRLPWREPLGSCYGFDEREPRFVLTALVRTTDFRQLDSARVTLEWTQPMRSSLMTTTIETHTEADGFMQACGLPGNVPLEATVIWRGVEYRGTTTVPRIDYDERGRRRAGNLRSLTIVVGRTGRGG